MVKLKTHSGLVISFVSEISEMTANRYFLLRRMLIIKNSTSISDCLDRISFFMKHDKKEHLAKEILLLKQGIHFEKEDIDIRFAVLACLEASKEVSTISEVIEKEKFIRGLKIDDLELSEISEGLKKKLIQSLRL